MKNLKILTLALGLSSSFALSACGGGGTLDKMKDVKNKVCACKDMACVEKVTKANKDLDGKLDKLSDDEKKKAMAIGLEMAACISKLSQPGGE